MEENIEKYLSGTGTTDEQKKLLDWLRKEENREKFNRFKEKWIAENAETGIPDDIQKMWIKMQERMLTQNLSALKRRKIQIHTWRSAAAVMLICLLTGAGLYTAKTLLDSSLRYTTVSADNGQLSKILLPDSSEVWINSGSSVSYNNRYGSGNRDIRLTGEAYFKVKHNTALPLTVCSQDIQVTVVGTQFSMSAYPEDSKVEVVLEKGKVKIESPENFSGYYLLAPGELACFSKADKKIVIKQVNTSLYTSWKEGTMNFYNLPLKEIALRLKKRYNQKFGYDKATEDIPYTFTIKNESLKDILNMMEQITPIRIVQRGDSIIFCQREHP